MIDLAGQQDIAAPSAGTPPRTARRRLGALIRRDPVRIRFDRTGALAAAALYLAIAAVGATVLTLLSGHLGYSANFVLHRWDSDNYLKVAQYGYPHHLRYLPDGRPKWSTLAFFPLVPALIAGVHLLTALPYPYAGVVVSWLAATVAAVGVHTLARSLAGRWAGYACVGLWACSPYAFALWVPYSEACFTAALVWALVALLARRWLVAGLLTAVAGTIRPTAAVLVIVVLISATAQIVRDLRRRRDGGDARGWRWRPWAALALAPLGLAFSWLYIGAQVGRVDGWFQAEKAWGQSFDFGRGTLHFIGTVAGYGHVDIRYPMVLAVIALPLVAAVALAVDRRVPWPLVLTLAGAWELMIGTPGSPMSKPRFMLPFLPIALLLVARPMARLPRPVRGGVYVAGAVFAGWYAVALLLLLRWSP